MLDVTPVRWRFGKSRLSSNEASAGVLTAADAAFFPGLQLLSASLGDTVPLGIVDLGMTDEQREWCLAQTARRLLPETVWMPRHVKMWQTWNKPFYLAYSPFRRTVWIDSDCVVVGDLDPLFCELERGPFAVRHWQVPYPEPNKDELYERYPVPVRLSPDEGINAGVVGLDVERDVDLLDAWCAIVRAAAKEPTIRSLISWLDEGALHWALQATRRLDRLLVQPGWNRFIPSRRTPDPNGFVQRIVCLPGDVIWHFAGPVKFW